MQTPAPRLAPVLVADAAAVDALARALASEPTFALDTESNSFHVYRERVCLIQISTREADYVVDPLVADPRPLGRPGLGLSALVEHHFGVRLTKDFQRSDWGKRPLAPEQVGYAALDTHFLLPLYDLLE